MEHPFKEQQENQKKFLAELPADLREEHAQLFRIGNATFCYHRLADQQEPNENDFKDWLEGLPDNIKKDMKTKGFQECKGILSFTRFVNEKNDIGMGEWMKQNLSLEDYKSYSQHKE